MIPACNRNWKIALARSSQCPLHITYGDRRMMMMEDFDPEALTGYWNAIAGRISRWSWAEIIFADGRMDGEAFSRRLSKLETPASVLRRFHLKLSFPTHNVGFFGGYAPLLQDLKLYGVALENWDFLTTTSNLQKLHLSLTRGLSLQNFADLLWKNSSLETINLMKVPLSTSAVSLQGAAPISLPKLKSLIFNMISASTMTPLLSLLRLPALAYLSVIPPTSSIDFFVALHNCLAHTVNARAPCPEVNHRTPSELSIFPDSLGLKLGLTTTPLSVQLCVFDDTRMLLDICLLPMLELPHTRMMSMAIEMDCTGEMDQADFVEYMWRLPQVVSLHVHDAMSDWGDVNHFIDSLATPIQYNTIRLPSGLQ